ncbi:coiled-coil domain-containing protein [Maudiozyma humilis]|uniref:Spindle assembly checkpoint component MAD1 n=1 Tax=Maudiozyma humilis TaxID=51915 RepID=A0AAV5RUW1_MAUHU|nr:coiled-coil domain-containing protein [Kazachstania humilis]
MSDDSSYSGGSSPFLEAPDVAVETRGDIHIPTVVASAEVPTTNRGDGLDNHNAEKAQVSPDNDFERQLMTLKYKYSTLQNEYDLEQLQTQRQINELDKKYRTAIEELEASIDESKQLHNENIQLRDTLDALKLEKNADDDEEQDEIILLKRELAAKSQELEELKLSEQSNEDEYQFQIGNLQAEKKAADDLADKLNRELIKQNNEVKRLSKVVNEKDDEILELQNVKIMNSHPNYNTEEFQELSTMNKLFKEQSEYCKELEEINLKQGEDIKKLRNIEDSSNFWKSEIEKLEGQVREAQSLKEKFETSQMEVIDLKEKLAEFSIFSEEMQQGDLAKLNPADLMNNLELLQQENLTLIDENTKMNLTVNNMKILNEELALERTQLLDLNKSYENNIINLKKLNYELEQQKILSFEECKMLNKQLEEYQKSSAENAENTGTLHTDLEQNNIIADYRNRTEELTGELQKLNDQLIQSQKEEEQGVKKRKLKEVNGMTYYSQRINELQLENSKLTRDLQKFQNLNGLLETKLMKLINLKEKKIRIVELRDNPLRKDQFVKKQQLDLLKKENADLLKASMGEERINTVPTSVYNSLKFDIQQQEQEILKANKKFMRLKEIFNKKSLEFIDVVNSILGFKLEFRQDGKVKIYSCYKPDKSLMVDLRKNTLDSTLQLENWDELLQYWITERGQIPCFLATLTLQLWESSQAM